MKGQMKKHVILLLSLAVILMIATSLQAKDKVVVIPLSASKSMNNIVTVAKSGGDFTDLQKAIDSITDANELNPYLIVIAPGWYKVEQTITMKPYVSISGRGQDITILEGNIGGDSMENSAIIKGSLFGMISNLSIINYGSNSTTQYAVGLYCKLGIMSLKNVDVYVQAGATRTRAVCNMGTSNLKLDNATLTSYGYAPVAFWNGGTATANLSNAQLKVNGEDSRAFVNDDTATAHLTHVTAIAEGSGSVGLYNTPNCESHVDDSELSGDTYGVIIGSEKTRIRNTIIHHSVIDMSGTNCKNTYTPNFADINC